MNPRARLRDLAPSALAAVALTACLTASLTTGLTACVSAGRAPGGDISRECLAGQAVEPAWEWFDSPSGPVRGSVLVTHGLNSTPKIMTALIEELTADGLDVLRISLPAECGGRPRAAAPIEAGWLEAIAAGFEELSSRPAEHRYALAYSLGAIVSLAWLDTRDSLDLDAMALIAPPLKLGWPAKTVRLLTPFSRLGLYLPSMAPKRYRRRSRVSLASYRALLDTIANTRALARRDFFAQLPTAVFVSEKDEFVSYPGVVEWVRANGLDDWSLEIVEPNPDRDSYRHHLLVVPEHAGEEPWREMVDRILALFAVASELPDSELAAPE